MPRAKKTIAGPPGQKVQAVVGQTYGDGVRQENLQRTMPAPDVQMVQPPAPLPAATSSASPADNAGPPMSQPPKLSFAEAMQKIQGVGGLLRAPDDNPSIPVTDGLASGPGRGPEVLNANSQLGNTLRRLAMQTGDPIFRELASKVRF